MQPTGVHCSPRTSRGLELGLSIPRMSFERELTLLEHGERYVPPLATETTTANTNASVERVKRMVAMSD